MAYFDKTALVIEKKLKIQKVYKDDNSNGQITISKSLTSAFGSGQLKASINFDFKNYLFGVI